MGVHLGLVSEKLKRPARYYEAEVEEAISKFLNSCFIEAFPTKTGKLKLNVIRN